jgi:hypothetical protein
LGNLTNYFGKKGSEIPMAYHIAKLIPDGLKSQLGKPEEGISEGTPS